MNISLKPEHEQFIQAQIASGKFANADEVIDLAFKLLEKLDNEYIQWLEQTRQKVEVGLAQIERGEVIDGEVVIDRLRGCLRNQKCHAVRKACRRHTERQRSERECVRLSAQHLKN
jgi:antitoxin ParD1/3/4